MSFFRSFRHWLQGRGQNPIQKRKDLHKRPRAKVQLEHLELRLAPATTPVFVNDNWNLIVDNGVIGTLDAGDQVRNDNDAGTTIIAILGTDGFGTVTTSSVGTVTGVPGSVTGAATLQDAIDNATSGGIVNILPGTYGLTGSASPASGIDIPKPLTLQATDFVDATPDNTTTILVGVDASAIDIRINSADVILRGFTLDFNGAANTRQIGGIEANGNPNLQNIHILNNRVELSDADPVAFAFGDYAFRTGGPHDFSGLQINNNDFVANGPNGGLGIFFNPDAGVGAKQFNTNTFSGKLLQGISVDTASNITIDGNTLNSTLTTAVSDNPKMIRVMPFGAGTQSNIVISNNSIGAAGANMGGRQGIIIGSTTGTVTDATITNNVVNNTSLRPCSPTA